MSESIDLNLSNLPPVSPQAAEEYEKKAENLIEKVNDSLEHREDVRQLIGKNPLKKAFENHKHHARFMTNVFKLNDYELLIKTSVWVYRTYHRHGFSYDYFPVELQSWMEAVKNGLEKESAEQICKIYSFMLENHRQFIESAQKAEEYGFEISERWEEINGQFLNALLESDHKQALEITQENVNSQPEVGEFFENVIKPTMYEVGTKWEKGEISVAEEHLISSIVSRVLSTIYSRFISFDKTKGKAVVTATANEFHEIGSRIIADSLEMDGWNVDHLGVDTPIPDLIDFLLEKKPFLLGLSVAIPFNIEQAIETIDRIRSNSELEGLKILIGGKTFNDNPELWKKTGADAWSRDCKEAVNKAGKWWREEA